MNGYFFKFASIPNPGQQYNVDPDVQTRGRAYKPHYAMPPTGNGAAYDEWLMGIRRALSMDPEVEKALAGVILAQHENGHPVLSWMNENNILGGTVHNLTFRGAELGRWYNSKWDPKAPHGAYAGIGGYDRPGAADDPYEHELATGRVRAAIDSNTKFRDKYIADRMAQVKRPEGPWWKNLGNKAVLYDLAKKHPNFYAAYAKWKKLPGSPEALGLDTFGLHYPTPAASRVNRIAQQTANTPAIPQKRVVQPATATG